MHSSGSCGLVVALLSAWLILAGCEQVTVTVVEVTQVEVQPAEGEMLVGETLPLTAVLLDDSGNPLQDRPVDWFTGNPSVAQISADGVVSAQAPGIVPIKASVAGVEGTAHIRVLTPAQIGVADQVVFVGQVGQPGPPVQLLSITNSGEAPLSDLSLDILFSDGEPAGWLTADLQPPAGGTAARLTADVAGLASGAYSARLRISSPRAANSPVDVDVALLLVGAEPFIQLSAAALGYLWEAGLPAPPPVTVDVWNGGAGVLAGLEISIVYEAGQPSGWLDARLMASSAPTEMEITATPSALPNGSYTAWVVLSSPAAVNSPELRVRLTIGDQAPQILLNPSRLDLFGVAGESSVRSGLARVENESAGPLSGLSVIIQYPPGVPTGWLTATLAGSTAPTDLTVEANAGGLTVGTYGAVVRVEAEAALNSPQLLDVVFHVSAPVSASQSVIESAHATLEADGTSTSMITVRLRDSSGAPVNSGGHQVGISTTAGHLSQVLARPDGTYQATLTAPTTVGVATITGEVEGSAIGEGATVTFVAGAASAEHSILTVEALGAPAEAESDVHAAAAEHDFRVVAELRDRWENPLGRGGDQVSFSSSQGTLGPVEDHGDGTYSATLSVSGDVNSFTVTGEVNGTELAESDPVEPPPGEDPPDDDPPNDDPPNDDPPDDDPPDDDPPNDDPPDDDSPDDDPDDDGDDGDDDDPDDDPTIASVQEITYWTTAGPNSDLHLRGILSVVDGLGNPLRSASVSMVLTNEDTGQTWSDSGVSDDDGEVTFALNHHPDGCYLTRVVSLSATGYTWDGETPSNGICKSSNDAPAEVSSTP